MTKTKNKLAYAKLGVFIVTLVFLFLIGIVGGIVNAVAGGGSFIMFPALLFAGVPPVLANASNTYACLPGYAAGAAGLWKYIAPYKHKLIGYSVIALIGGYLGAEALMQVSDAQFSVIIPWLMLFAVLIYIFGARINNAVVRWSRGRRGAATAGAVGLSVLLFALCLYGGFFNAGLGIILLAFLALAGHDNVHAMNGLKLWISSVIALVAVVRFIATGAIAWPEGTAALLGALIGGFASAHIAHRIPTKLIRSFVIVYGVGLTAYFFYITYIG